MNILIELKRHIKLKERTFGQMKILGVNSAVTVEDTIRDNTKKIKGKQAIPDGIYELDLRHSPKFSDSFYYSKKLKRLISKTEYVRLKNKLDYVPHLLIWIKNVENEFISFELVLIHWGNTELDTEGCIVVGTEIINNKSISFSRSKYQNIYPTLFEQISTGEKKFIKIEN